MNLKQFALIVNLLAGLCALAPLTAQEIPSGVHYKKAPEELNRSAKALIEGALADPSRFPAPLLDDVATCGPMLWQELSPSANAVLRGSKVVDLFLQRPEAVHIEARGLLTEEQRKSFWTAFAAAHPNIKGAHVRKANTEEIAFYGATIFFNIEEPLFVIEAGSDRFVLNFIVREGKPHLLWIDHIGDLRTLKGKPAEAKDAGTATADFVEEQSLPQGWKRYRFTYDAGPTLSVVFPETPGEFSTPLQVPSKEPITVTGRAMAANGTGVGCAAFYAGRLSRDTAQMSGDDLSRVFAAMVSQYVQGLIKAVQKDGEAVQPVSEQPRSITVGKYKAIERNISMPPVKIRIWLIPGGLYCYAAVTVWKAGESEDLPKAFLGSLRIE